MRKSRASLAPPHHTLPAFLNLNGIETWFNREKCVTMEDLIISEISC